MSKSKVMYVIETDNPNGEFVKSIWCGEGYNKKSEAKAHLKFWKEHGMFQNENLTVGTEEAPAGW